MGLRRSCAALLWLLGCASSGDESPKPFDAGAGDGAASQPYRPPVVTYPGEKDERPFLLSEVGMFVDAAMHTLAPDLIAYEPAHALWSDGARKARYLRLPEGTHIDARDPAHFAPPKGGVLFKEFSSPDGKRLETRVIARLAENGTDADYFMGAFVWNDDESDARFARLGAENVRGTQHDVPAQERCSTCHRGEPGRMLGLSVVQQSAGSKPGLEVLDAMGLFSPTLHGRVKASIPGDEVARAALGYLHANCGHCHNPMGSARPDTDMHLRVYPGDAKVEDTEIYESTVGVMLQNFMDEGVLRVTPGDPEHSALYVRMRSREMKIGMPPIASEVVDDAGLRKVRAWIASLPRVAP